MRQLPPTRKSSNVQNSCGDQRSIAADKGQLGTVRMLQQRYEEALAAYQEALKLFDALGEPGSVAVLGIKSAWYTGTHDSLNRLSEPIGKHSPLKVQQQNRSGEARSLHELGNLYDDMGRLEEAVAFYRQAADIYVTLSDLMHEGAARNNLAGTLMTLQRYDEARQELQRAIECKKPFGHAAEPWKTWALLHDLEQATGNAPAAADAWQQAVQCYLAYRRDGGESQHAWGATVCPHRACHPPGRHHRGHPIPCPGRSGSRHASPAQDHAAQAARHPPRRP